MNIHIVNLDHCSSARGLVVAIDVVRAFTTAAFAFYAGAKRILLAGTVDEAIALRNRYPGSLLMGEAGGMLVEGFDLWNSPAQFAGLDLTGKTVVQRTSAGTQGIVRSVSADHLYAASFVVAGSTARAIVELDPEEVTFVVTGERDDDFLHGPEDRACAEYMSALLMGESPAPNDYMNWIDTFFEQRLEGANDEILQAFAVDIQLCAQVDRFNFALQVERQDGLLVMERNP